MDEKEKLFLNEIRGRCIEAFNNSRNTFDNFEETAYGKVYNSLFQFEEEKKNNAVKQIS